MNIKYLLTGSILSSALIFGATSCKKDYLETRPTRSVSQEDVFSTTTNAYIALNGMHSMMNTAGASGSSQHYDFGAKSFDMAMDLMGTDMVYDVNWGQMYGYLIFNAAASASAGHNTIIWNYYYRLINNANIIIANIDNATGPDAEKNDIKAQAYTYRAWSYSRLVQLYTKQPYSLNQSAKGIPLYTEPTSATTTGNPRGLVTDVYNLIEDDLNKAIDLFPNGVARSSKSNLDISVAKGIYARVALTKGDYPKAKTMASEARAGYALMSVNDYTSGFNNSGISEIMWSSTRSAQQNNDMGIISFIGMMDPFAAGYAYAGDYQGMAKALYDSIKTDDVRGKVFFNAGSSGSPDERLVTDRGIYYVQKKFLSRDPNMFDADIFLMRASEMLLIEAEAAARGAGGDARALLSELLAARGTSYTPSGNDLNDVLLQRRIELWGEGFGLLDYLRTNVGIVKPTGNGNFTGRSAVPASRATIPVSSPLRLWKIPQAEFNGNKSLDPITDQN